MPGLFPGVSYPQIGGYRCTHADMQFFLAPTPSIGSTPKNFVNAAAIPFAPVIGVKSLKWKQTKKTGKVYGTAVSPIGKTRGKYEASATLEVYEEEAAIIKQLFAQFNNSGGFMETIFSVLINYTVAETAALGAMQLIGCNIDDEDHTSTAGSEEAMSVSLELSPLLILSNGDQATLDQLNLAGAALLVP